MASSSIQLQAVVMVLALTGLSILVKETQAACPPDNSLASCLPAAQADVQPTTECCTELSAYVETDTPEVCLCQAAQSPTFINSGANALYAILIPQKCNLQFKAGTNCNGVVIPGGQ